MIEPHDCDDYDLDVVSMTCSCGESVFADSLEVAVDLFVHHAMMALTEPEDFYEVDEIPAEIQAQFAVGVKGVTIAPPFGQVVTDSGNIGNIALTEPEDQ